MHAPFNTSVFLVGRGHVTGSWLVCEIDRWPDWEGKYGWGEQDISCCTLKWAWVSACKVKYTSSLIVVKTDWVIPILCLELILLHWECFAQLRVQQQLDNSLHCPIGSRQSFWLLPHVPVESCFYLFHVCLATFFCYLAGQAALFRSKTLLHTFEQILVIFPTRCLLSRLIHSQPN